MNNCIACEDFVLHKCLQFVCGCDNAGLLQVIRGTLILVTFTLPFLFCVVHAYRTAFHKEQLSVTVYFRQNSFRDCITAQIAKAPYNTSTWTQHKIPRKDMLRFMSTCYVQNVDKITEHSLTVDVIYVILPFAFAASVNCLIWVNLTKSNHLTEHSIWDQNMDVEVVYYEMTFIIECALSNIMLIFLLASGNYVMDLLVYAFLLVGIETFFINIAKSGDRDMFDTMICFSILIVVFGIVLPYLPLLTNTKDANVIGLMVIFMIRLAFNISIHFAASGQLNAGYMILFRLINVIFVSFPLLFMMIAYE